jgi:hypothetical protein
MTTEGQAMEQDAFAYVAETAGSTAPRVVFLDTEVFDRAKYNFDSAVLQACADLAESHNLTLLIPRVTEDEIKRHIQERAEKAVDALQKAEKDAPLLKLWHKWPQQFPHQKATLSRSLCDNVSRKLLGFQNRFHVVRLEHEKKELERVLRRYHNGSAPFGTGRKKSEFPDALAIAAVEQYSDNLDLPVAVVSGDSDFQEACRYQDRLFSFASLSSFIDAVLTEDENAEKARKALDADDQLLIEEIREALTDTVVKSWGYDRRTDFRRCSLE